MFVWCDLETTGLKVLDSHQVIEAAFLVTDNQLNPVEGLSLNIPILPVSKDRIWSLMDEKVLKMHEESGLLDEILARGLSWGAAEEEMLNFVARCTGHFDVFRTPLCGSSIHFDRQFLSGLYPDVEQSFHYRNIDVSTLKELAYRWAPVPPAETPEEQKAHRAMPDILASIETLKQMRKLLMRPEIGEGID